ncbi:MAG TPA: Type 1 glutamine amidotransferase-like domain-containing protein [Kofleriaceae bacterium]|nr:Type 1 glutamine amidotransferase-like domain-containing protein [Kofleriaceae bacterium]
MTSAYLIAGAGPSTSRRSVRFHAACAAALGPSPTIAYVGACAGDDPTFAARVQALVFGPAARVVPVSLTSRTATSTLRARLAGADLVFFTGGDVERGMQLVDERGLAPYLRDLARAGKPMEGLSAGAILLGRQWIAYPEGAEPRLFDCLGVVPATFDTHGEEDGWSELRDLARRAPAGDVVYGIPSHGAARWDGATLHALGVPLARFRCGPRPRALASLAPAP